MLRPLQRNWPHFEQFSDGARVDLAAILFPQIIPPPLNSPNKEGPDLGIPSKKLAFT